MFSRAKPREFLNNILTVTRWSGASGWLTFAVELSAVIFDWQTIFVSPFTPGDFSRRNACLMAIRRSVQHTQND
jgi:hypothetical protein